MRIEIDEVVCDIGFKYFYEKVLCEEQHKNEKHFVERLLDDKAKVFVKLDEYFCCFTTLNKVLEALRFDQRKIAKYCGIENANKKFKDYKQYFGVLWDYYNQCGSIESVYEKDFNDYYDNYLQSKYWGVYETYDEAQKRIDFLHNYWNIKTV